MYFNDKGTETNIDNEFGNKEKNKKFKVSKLMWILFIGLGLVFLFIVYRLFFYSKVEYFLMLNGSEDVIVYQYSEYIDEGALAYDSNGNEFNDEVIVSGVVNTAITGEYQLKYQYRDQEVTRIVTVLPANDRKTFLVLKGEAIMFLNVGDSYVEPGYTVLDSSNEFVNDSVMVTGSVDTSKAGTYKLVYTLAGEKITMVEERTVIVMGSDTNVSYSPNDYTNGKVTIYLVDNDNYFDYVMLPDGSKKNERNIKYEVSVNGSYKFKIYTKTGTFKEEVVTIKNIDTDKPSGSCSGYYLDNKTYVTVSAKDTGSGVVKYVINGKEFSSNKITLSGEMKSINVNIYDKAGNNSVISCQLEDKNPITSACNDKTIYPGHKYVFTQAQKEKMAAMVSTEADGDPKKAEDYLGMKLVASHMCNYYEKLYPDEDWSGKRLHWLITNSSWYAEMTKKSKYNQNNERHQLALRAVEEVMEKGNRILPHYIDEFDMFPEDVMRPLSNVDDYIRDETIYYGYGWIKVTFWCINIGPDGKSGNIFGYTSKHSN